MKLQKYSPDKRWWSGVKGMTQAEHGEWVHHSDIDTQAKVCKWTRHEAGFYGSGCGAVWAGGCPKYCPHCGGLITEGRNEQ